MKGPKIHLLRLTGPPPPLPEGAAARQDSIITLSLFSRHINSHIKNQLTTSVVDYKSTIYIINYYIFNKWCAGEEAGKI